MKRGHSKNSRTLTNPRKILITRDGTKLRKSFSKGTKNDKRLLELERKEIEFLLLGRLSVGIIDCQPISTRFHFPRLN